MNEEALKDSYSLFTNTGYNGTQDEFYTLLSDNAEAFADSYGLFKDSGYNGSEDDYKELLGLKKKDASVLQDANAQMVSEVTPSTSDLSQPSLEQDVQSSLEERFSGYKDLPEDEQKSLRKQEELRPFFEANGLDLDEKLSFENKKKSLEEADRKEEEADEELGFFERLYKNITSPEEVEDMFTTEEDSVNNYFAQNSDKIFEAEKQYNQAKVEQIKSNYPPQERLAQFKAEGIDLGYIPIKNLKINNEEVSIKEFEKKAYDQEFIDQLQAGEVSMEVLDTQDNEVLENLNNLMTRQMESGGQWGDIAQSFYAGGLDMLVAGPLNLLERVGMQGNLYEQTMYKLRGGYWANKVHKYANSQRDKTRLYEQSSMTESLLDGNYGDAMFQAGNALAESTPLILGMYASAPLGLAEGATLGFAGISAGGLKDLELREQRLKGEIDISETMLLANSVLTGGAEMFFEKFTLDGINAGRKIAGLGKMKPTEIADKFVKGFSKQTAIEGLSEGATEFSNAITDLITGSAEYEGIEEIAVRISDATLVGGLMGGGMHTAPYLYQSLKKFEILDENISTVFTMEDGSVKEMSRAEALRFVKDPEVSDQIRRSAIKMDASMNDVAKKQLEEIIYGYYAPDAVESRARMFDKEKAVQEVLNKVEASEEVSTEDLNTLSEAMAEMEIEGKESKYNISSSTKSTRARAASVLKGKGVEIVNATQTQDLSGSNITETVNVSKIETKEQYDSVKKQIKNKSNKPKIVVSESQQSITVNGESVQSSEVVQGTFKNLNEAKNALKDFEVANKASKEEVVEQEFTSDELAQDDSTIRTEYYTITDGNGNSQTVEVKTSKDGSRRVELKDEEGTRYSSEKFSKDNPASNEQLIDGLHPFADFEYTLNKREGETREGFEANYSEQIVENRKKKLRAERPKSTTDSGLFPINNKLFLQTKKEGLDDIPKEVIDNNDYHVLTSEKEGLTQEERDSRMSELKSMLDEAGATYYTVQGVYNGVAEESLVVTGIDNATALNIGNAFQQESIFSSKDGLMYGDGRVVPLKGGKPVKGPEARKMDALTIMNVGGRKVSLHSGLDWNNTSYGKNFNSENLHKLDESNADYDAELFQGITEDRKRALGFALKFLNSIGGLNVTVIRNSEAMQGQIKSIQKNRYIKDGMSEEKAEVEANKYASERRGGSFFLDKTIYVNLETVRGNTLFHEIIHPMVDFIKKTDPALYKRIEAEVAEGKVKRRTTKGGRKIKGSYLEWAQNNPAYASLSREEQIEEAFAEMMGDAAYGHFKNKGTRLNRLREVIKAILTKLGVTSLPENVEAIDLDDMSLSDIRTNLAEALVDGRKVNVGGVEFEVGETDAESRFQLDAIDRRTQVQYTYDVNSKEFADMEADGLITSGMTIQDFAGKTMMIHSPDATFSGSIIDKDGTILVEGKGGIYYTFKHSEGGYFWASTDNAANSMAKQLNSMLEANGGKIYMGLTTAREGKLLSNTAMSRGVVNLFTSPNFISKIGLSKPTLYKALIDAANQTSPLGDGLKLGLKPYRASSKFEGDVLEKVWDKLDNKKTSFKDRKFFTDKFLTLAKQSLESGSSKTNFVNFIKTTMGDESLVKFNNKGEPNVTSMKKALINVLTEPELRGEEVTDKVYAVLEIDGPVKAIKTDEYESYGTAIVSESGNRAKIHRLDNREFWYDVAEDPMTNTVIGENTGRSIKSGKISSRRSQIMPPTAGVSTTPLKISEKIRMQAPTLFNEPNPETADISKSYLLDKATELGVDQYSDVRFVNRLDENNSKMIADAYDNLIEDPKNAEVKSAYQALANETILQHEAILNKGYDVEIWDGKGEPYKNSAEMISDVRDNKHMYIFGTEAGFGEGEITPEKRSENAMLAKTQYKDVNGKTLLVNDLFRFVHDFFGHTELGNGFGPIGEENAWLNHSRMYSPEARKAMTTETRGQNSWVNFNKNLRREDGSIPKRGDNDYTPLSERPFADQKMGILPDNIVNPKNLRFQAPTYEMEYTPNSLVSLAMLSDNNRQPEQWVKEIGKGLKGASKDVDTMGLLDILKAYKKDAKVKSISKEVVAQLIATNMADIETKIFGKEAVINYDDYYIGYDGENYSVETPDGQIFDTGKKSSIEVEELSDLSTQMLVNKVLIENDMFPEAQYSAFTLPGGENYREFLIKDKSPEEIFTAPHYDGIGEGKNLIASARVDDRVGPNGEKILFVQEIQSDWVQGVNKGNFVTKEKIASADLQINSLNKELEASEERLEKMIEDTDSPFSSEKMMREKDYIEDLKAKITFLEIDKKGRPYLPWNQTDLWVGLTIRKLINQASKEGYDQIAFVNGEQSDIVQSHTGENKGLTHEFYNKIVPKNINNELKRLVKGMKYGVSEFIGDFTKTDVTQSYEDYLELSEKERGEKLNISNKNAVINLTPELKAATDKVGPLRFQVPQEEGESNVYTDGLVSIGWDISKAMQDLNYMSGTYLTGFIDQDSFRPKKRKRYDIKLTTLLAKPFGTHSDKEVKEIMVRSRGALNSAIIEANEVGKRLKELNEKYNYTEQELNDFLHDHNKIKALEDSDIKNTLIEMRMSIDDLSKTLIAEDLIAGQTMFTVDSNLGLYVTQAYKNFEVKGWEQTDNLIIKKLKEFLRREAKKDNPDATEERLNQIVDVSYEELNSDKEFAYNVKNGGSLDGLSRLTSIFKQRKEIPQEIKDFWGEIDDPIFNYNNTIKKMAQTITAERMYKELYEIGNGKFISDTKTLDTFNELVGAKWGSIEGKFVDNEMFAVMNQIAPEKGTGTFNWIFDKYMELVLLNKKTKTVWNIGTHFKNIIGNTAFATMNGHIGFRGGMYQDAKASLKAVASSSDAELNAIRKNLIEKGVLSSSASLEEIRNISKDLGDTDYDLSKYLDEKNGKIQKLMSKSVRYVGKPLKYLDDKFTRAYQAEDDVWKFYGFLSEKARYIEAGLSEKEADDMAARNIINLYPNYNEIPRIIRYIGRSPLVGSFVAFQAESFRNAKNAVKLGFEEMGSSNPKIKKIGTTRIAGTIATMTLLEGLQLYTMQFLSQALGLAGGDEEESEERRLRTMVAQWDRDGSLAYVDSGVLDSKTNENQMENDKYFDYINFSSISGVGHIRDILRLSFTDIDTEVGKESAYSIVKKMYEPFLGEEMTLATFLEAYENKGDRIYSRTDDAATATLKMIEYVGKRVAMPGVGRNFIRIKESFEQDSERVPTYETLALFGLRISRTNLNKTLSINARNAYNDMRSRSSDSIIRDKTLLLNEMKNNPDLDNDLNIIADLMAGCRLNKVAGRDTKAILKGMGISDVVIDLAYNRMLKNYKQDVLSVDAK